MHVAVAIGVTRPDVKDAAVDDDARRAIEGRVPSPNALERCRTGRNAHSQTRKEREQRYEQKTCQRPACSERPSGVRHLLHHHRVAQSQGMGAQRRRRMLNRPNERVAREGDLSCSTFVA